MHFCIFFFLHFCFPPLLTFNEKIITNNRTSEKYFFISWAPNCFPVSLSPSSNMLQNSAGRHFGFCAQFEACLQCLPAANGHNARQTDYQVRFDSPKILFQACLQCSPPDSNGQNARPANRLSRFTLSKSHNGPLTQISCPDIRIFGHKFIIGILYVYQLQTGGWVWVVK